MSIIALATMLAAINATPQAAVDAYGEAVARNDPALLARAFEPSAIMYCIQDGAIRATYQAQWKTRMRAGTAPTGPISTKLQWLDQGTSTALARATAIRGSKTFTDYLLLARIDGSWRVIGKTCQADARYFPASQAAVGAVVDTKLASDRAWDGDLLAKSIHPRALVMTIEDGELVAATLAEWQARYVDRRTSSSGNAVIETSRVVDARGDIGVARWSFRTPAGDIWTDRALMIRTPAGWRMMALAFAKEVPTAR
ncbi:nuclear transport factor 2 family protein [Sphingomonas sp.]|uniref:nuclear transport factor 2 family protein n=1 Tax=Sphingomonas sp. TaxID=28214 RepID=UPI0026000AE4|nr:nuclear transport factor 2 family protein [Sphingomonas sp.]